MNHHMPLVVLDRDGTLNVDDLAFITSADDWIPVPGALEAVAKLNEAGWRVVVATNQSGLGRGLFDVGTLNDVHKKMHKLLASVGARVDAVFFCPPHAQRRLRVSQAFARLDHTHWRALWGPIVQGACGWQYRAAYAGGPCGRWPAAFAAGRQVGTLHARQPAPRLTAQHHRTRGFARLRRLLVEHKQGIKLSLCICLPV